MNLKNKNKQANCSYILDNKIKQEFEYNLYNIIKIKRLFRSNIDIGNI